MFDIRGLSKFYGKALALKDLSLQFDRSMFVALLGRNGSGKSTLMRLMAQQDTWTSGDLLFEGKSLSSPRVEINRRMVSITEDQTLPFDHSIEEWSHHFAQISESYDRTIFDRLCAEFDLDRTKIFSQLSRGQRMKALFALQAPRRPDLYLLDEITSVLDAGSRLSMLRFLAEEHARGAFVLLSTNIASEMQGFASHFCFISPTGVELFCSTNEFGKHFRKVRLASNDLRAPDAARRVHFNSDGSWSYLISTKKIEADHDVLPDRREITIEDVSAYFSSERKAA